MFGEWMTRMRSRFDGETRTQRRPTKSRDDASSLHRRDNIIRIRQHLWHRMQKSHDRHLVGSFDAESDENTGPCVLCGLRYGTVKTDVCTHDLVCKFCAYRMLDEGLFPSTKKVACLVCAKEIHRFYRLYRARFTVCSPSRKIGGADDEEVEEEEEETTTIEQLAYEFLERSRHSNFGHHHHHHHVNRGE
ncbi:unnamed protein product [Caenorhabditis bovis]|uniref:RING-type domain-containing protein n=1 Tax=Caenorhabditis bovis TaxID=2654633 RepID=A0A8S1EQI6_9PELO|nr:unnamed protein product [Caenorhabditis bovis]